MDNKEWILLISKEFNVSHTMAKKMYHAMLSIFKIHNEVKKEGDKNGN